MKAQLSLISLCLLSLSASAGTLDAAVQAYKDGRLAEAKSQFLAAKDEPEAKLYLARIAHREGKLDEAEEAFEALGETLKQNPELHMHWGALLCDQAQAASMFSALGYAKDCAKHFAEAVKLKPDNLDYRRALFEFYVSAPGIAGGGTDKARTLVAEAEKQDPAYALMMRARIAQADEEYDEAETLMKQAVAKAPEREEYPFQLGLMYQQAERYGQAMDHFAALAKAKPERKSTLYQLGRSALLGKLRLAEGEQAMLEYLKAPVAAGEPSHAWARLRLAQIYALMGKKAESKSQLELAQAQAGGDERLLEQVKKARG